MTWGGERQRAEDTPEQEPGHACARGGTTHGTLSSWHRLIVKCAAWNHPSTDVNEGALDRRGCAAVCSEGQCEAPAPAVGA